MELLRMLSYTDGKYTQKNADAISIPVNPESLTFEKGITYAEDKQLGTTNSNNVFECYRPEKLSFSFLVDCTGVVEGSKEEENAHTRIEELEKSLYNYNNEAHRPSYIVIAYGELLFKGQLTSMKVAYTLFNNAGIPLRAKVDIAFSGFRGSEEDKKKFFKNSPDISRMIVVKESDTLAALCHRIYGDSLLVDQVARFNNLNEYRHIPPGTELLFPPLKKN